jgi:thiamine-monophosphate kinase
MRLSEMGEFGLIAELRRMLVTQAEGLVEGVGDDAAVFESRQGGLWAFTMDALVEGVHFDTAYVSWHALGYKSLAVNISDLAAMGGSTTSFALVALGLGGEMDVEAVEEIYRGLNECGERYNCLIVGGDVVNSPSGMFLSVALVGHIPGDKFLTRDRARPGQVVMVTGTLGDSYLGWRWLKEGKSEDNACARRHLYPQPRLEEGERALYLGATAAIDVSDGLVRDLGHICEESGVGAEIRTDAVPLSPAAREMAQGLGEEPLQAALHGGEDYELILVAPDDAAVRFQEELGVAVIGEIKEGEGIRMLEPSGRPIELDKSGWEHFKEE